MENVDLKLVIALARAHSALFGLVEKSLKKDGLTISEFGVLELLYHKGTQPVQLIAEKILVTSGTITYIINKLSDKGFVNRKKCTKDKRIFYVELTEAGDEKIAEIFSAHEAFLKSLFEKMDEDVKSELVTHLFSFKEIIEAYEA
jgi:MarR family 2-MHQ and catechol resistance regulon transcriptional repressor